MKTTFQLLSLSICIIFLFACEEKKEPAKAPEPAYNGEKVGWGEVGEISTYSAAALTESELSKKLKRLDFYQNPNATEEEKEFELVTLFYPLGWSEEDKFAYAQFSESYHGEKMVTYIIQNMSTGDTLWKKESEYYLASGSSEVFLEGFPNAVILTNGDETEDELFKYCWRLDESEVANQLEAEGITLTSVGKFMRPAKYTDASFEIEATNNEEEDPPIQYIIKSDKYDPIVFHEDYFPANGTEIVGLNQSPSGENIIVFVMQKQHLFEMTSAVVPILLGYPVD